MLSSIPIPTLIELYLSLYALVSAGLFFYGMHAYLVSALFLHVRKREQPLPESDALPRVTVQLPIFNELYVIDRLVEAACALDYPRDRLEIQVLDDSTDETRGRAAELCARQRARGIDIVHLYRTRRTGYKGGALREGLARAKGELIAVFDADFVPPREFLRRVVPAFADPGIGMVQARWGHLNEDYSALTRAQGMALDGHFIIEQTVRNRTGACINFNGTAGIWRKRCILDAGNWQDDTLTEDLDLSYRAQLAGWRFLYLPEMICPAELPVEINAFKGQQFRWAKGSVQTAMKVLPRLLSAKGLSLFAKFQATVHLTNHFVYPLLLILAILTLPSLMVLENHPSTEPFFRMMTILVIASFGHPVLYALSQHASRENPWRRLAWVPMVIAGGMGIAVNNTRAVIEALRGQSSPFIRTPKYRLVERTDTWARKRYRARGDWTAFIELGLAGYIALTIIYAAVTGRFLILPFLALYFLGFTYVGTLSLMHARRQAMRPTSARQPTAGPTGTRAATVVDSKILEPTAAVERSESGYPLVEAR